MSALPGNFKLHYANFENNKERGIRMIHRNQTRVNFNTTFLLQKYCCKRDDLKQNVQVTGCCNTMQNTVEIYIPQTLKMR